MSSPTRAQRHLGSLVSALADALPPMTPEEAAAWDACLARRAQRQADRDAARSAATEADRG